MCIGTGKTDTSPSSPSSGNILGNYSDKSNKGCGGTELEINLGYHQIYPWCIFTPSRGRTGRGESGACTGKGQTKSDQGRKTSVESLSTPPSRAGRGALGGKKPWLWMLLFSLLQMGTNSSRTIPLKCIKTTTTTGTSLIPTV